MDWISVEDKLPPVGKEIEFRFKDLCGGGTCKGGYLGRRKGLFYPPEKEFPVFSGTMQNGRITTKDAFEWREEEK